MKLLRTNSLSKQIAKNLVGDPGGIPSQDFWRGSWTGTCDREAGYQFGRVVQSNPADALTQERMDKGTLYGAHIEQKLINKHTDYKVLFCEETLYGEIDGIKIKGHNDGIIFKLRKVGNRYAYFPVALLEVKTTSQYGYDTTKNAFGVDETSWWYTSYYPQTNRYLHLWNAKYPHLAVKEVCVFLYNVNGRLDEGTNFCSRDWWYKCSTKDFKEDIARLRRIQEEVTNGNLPQRGYEKKSEWSCKRCWWRDKCWSED